jgi:hypothetical protein
MQGGLTVGMGWVLRRGRHRIATVSPIRDPLEARVAACEAHVSHLYVTMSKAAEAAGVTIPDREATKPMPALRLVQDDDVADSA